MPRFLDKAACPPTMRQASLIASRLLLINGFL
ncbi:hypothetical protein [Klebsiella phage KpF5]|nr:hypothetical protein [Klebsiella phage KpF5]DAL34443.1 MAG TPA_asm: hypothetical protein [Bacteriophage sp.]DAZ20594.1 MAG TPA: hypothetical protein [Caudoviricetes sp.]